MPELSRPEKSRLRIVIDCDPGNGIPGANVDDAIALAYALRCERLDVAAIWTVCGNTSAAEGYDAANRLLTELHTTGVPVLQGCDTPLAGPGARANWRARLDAPSQDPTVYSRWGATGPTRRYGTAETGGAGNSGDSDDASSIERLAASLVASGSGTTLACLGPLTNVARLFTDEPSACRGVERICLMGGYLAGGREVDTNFAVDPQAAHRVLTAGIPVTVVPLDVTRTTVLTASHWTHLRDSTTGQHAKDARTIGTWLEPWLAHSEATRPVQGMWIHDLVVLIALTHPELVSSERTRVSIRQQPPGKLRRDDSGTEVELITAVDNTGLISTWANTVLGVIPAQ